MESKKQKYNKVETDTKNKQMVAKGEGGEMGKGDYTKFQLQNKSIAGMKCTVWGI